MEQKAYSDLPDVTYLKGLNTANAASFASATGVIAAINESSAFVLTNKTYPEFAFVSETHTHKGGTASCSAFAVCEECGLEYGEYDTSVHLTSKLLDPVDPVWVFDGNTGNTVCADCGEILIPGEVIKADTEKTACTVTIRYEDEEEPHFTKVYTIAEFDKLAKTKRVVYTYGTSGNKVVSTRYVTFEDIMNDIGFDEDNIIKLNPNGNGTTIPLTKVQYETCNRYYPDLSGSTYEDAPAAFMITYASGTAKPSVLEKLATTPGDLRLGYGVSEENKSTGGEGWRLTGGMDALEIVASRPAIDITEQPEDVEIIEGENAVFTVAAEGSGLTYQWQVSKNGGSTWQNAGSTSAELTIADAPLSANGNLYRCAIMNSDGNEAVSASAKLTVNSSTIDISTGSIDKIADVQLGEDVTANVRVGGKLLTEGTDYIAYYDTSVAGTAVYTAEGIGAYAGTLTTEFTVIWPFTDVPSNSFAYEHIGWAYVNGITTGTSATTFSPKKTCTRGEVVTFLWRTAGKPEPETTVNPFTDVNEKSFYYKAVLWAFENGITTGTSATTFTPGATCTRSEVVTFLWRYLGKPEPETSTNPFTDVESGKFYYKSVLWAYENKVTTGTSATTFSPSATCLRDQVVTFLHRAVLIGE